MKDSLAGTVIRWISLGVVFLVTIEMTVRVEQKVKWGAPLIGKYTHGHLITRDSVTIKGRPNFRYEKWGMNSFGFRGPEIEEVKTPGTIRVATLGASETFGLFESEGSEYPAQLRTILDSLAPGKFEVINVGLPGMTPGAMLPYIHTVLSKFDLDIVTVYPSPSFFLEDRPPADSLRLPPPSPPATGLRALLDSRPRTFEKLKVVAKRVLPLQIQIAIREHRLAQARSSLGEGQVWQSVPEDRIEMFREQMSRVVVTLKSIDAEPILVTHVNRYLHKASDWYLEDVQHLLAVQSSYWPRASEAVVIGIDSATNRHLRNIAQERSLLIVDVEYLISSDGLHFADYSHFTDKGAFLLAKEIATHLTIVH